MRPLASVAGRPMLGGLKLLLGSFRLFNAPEAARLPGLLTASRERQDSFGGMHFLKRQGDGNPENGPTFMAFDDVFDDFIDVAAGIKLLMRPIGKREEGTLKGLRCPLALEPVVDAPIAPKSLTAPRKI